MQLNGCGSLLEFTSAVGLTFKHNPSFTIRNLNFKLFPQFALPAASWCNYASCGGLHEFKISFVNIKLYMENHKKKEVQSQQMKTDGCLAFTETQTSGFHLKTTAGPQYYQSTESRAQQAKGNASRTPSSETAFRHKTCLFLESLSLWT